MSGEFRWRDEVREGRREAETEREIKVESRTAIPMIHVCIQTEQRSGATRGAKRVGWHQSDTYGGKRIRRKTRWDLEVCVGVCGGDRVWRCQHSLSQRTALSFHQAAFLSSPQGLSRACASHDEGHIYITCTAHTTLAQKTNAQGSVQHSKSLKLLH